MRSDIVVIGGGPAGCAAAITALRHGLTVNILERHATPRDRPGECLHPGTGAVLASLGVGEALDAAGFLRYPGYRVCSGSGDAFHAYGADRRGIWLGYQVSRARLDGILLERAAEMGARIVRPCRPTEALFEGGKVAGVRCYADRFPARFAIDASVPGAWLRRRLALPAIRHSPPLIAACGYANGACLELDDCPIFTAEREGWTWSARVRERQYAWVRLTLERGRRWNSAPPAILAQLESQGPARAADVSWRIVERVAGPGYFLTGDAAAVMDPASSRGVLRALLSGIMAAEGASAVQRGDMSEQAAAENYDAWLRAGFTRDSGMLAEMYSALFPSIDTSRWRANSFSSITNANSPSTPSTVEWLTANLAARSAMVR